MRRKYLFKTLALLACLLCSMSATAVEAYACYTSDNTTLTFYYDNLRDTRTGTTYDLNTDYTVTDWKTDGTNANVTKVVFDPSFANARPTTTYSWFYKMGNLQSITGMQYLNTSEVTDMSWMFADCYVLESLDVSHFNTAKVTTMRYMFRDCNLLTSLDVSNFNTAKVTSMESMFDGLNAVTSLDVSNFNTAKVTNMGYMFSSCTALTSLDVSNFNTAQATNLRSMFSGNSALMSIDLSNFNTAQVKNMSCMFYGCSNLSTIYVSNGWDTDAVTSSDSMFWGCTNLVGGMGTTYDSNHLDKAYAHIDGGSSNPGYFTKDPNAPMPYACYTSSNTTLTFYCDYLRSTRTGMTYDLNEPGDVCDTGWYNDGSSSHVTTVVFDPSFADARPRGTTSWFQDMGNLTSIIGIEYLNTREVTDMSWMFSLCWGMETFDLSHFDTRKVTNMSYMFNYCEAMTNIDLSSFDTRNVMYMEGMFYECSALTSLDLSSFNTHNVKSFKEMFFDCAGLSSLDLSSFDTQNAETMNSMFIDCSGLTSINLSSFNTQHVDNMNNMFDGCSSLTSLDLSSFDTEYLLNTEWMFYSCRALTTVYVGENWDASNVENSDFMFNNCTSIVGSQGTTYDANHIDAAYAHIDGGLSNPGYFTAKYNPVMLPANEQYIDLTSFRADWTDETPANCVDDYTLEVVHISVLLNSMDASVFEFFGYEDWFFDEPWGGVNTRVGRGIIYFKNNYNGHATGCLTFTIPDGYTNATFSLVITSGSSENGAGNFTVYTPQTPAVGHDFVPGETYTWTVTASSGEKITVYTTDENYSPDISLIEVYLYDDCPVQLITGITDKFCTVENLEAGGTYQYRVKTLYIDGTESEWSNVEEVTLTENTHFLRGDVNGDGTVNIADVTALIDVLLSGSTPPAGADCNGDGMVNISDVTALVDYLLSGSW